MKIDRKTYRDGNLHPEAFNYLKCLPSNIDYYKNHTERHPLSIYSLSLQKVMKAFIAILDEIEQVNYALFNAEGKLDYSLTKLSILQKELLESLLYHIDDCYRVLKVLHPYSAIEERFVESWLQKAKNPAYKDFSQAIKSYRESFAPIVNKIKHNGSTLRAIIMHSHEQNLVTNPLEKKIKVFPENIRLAGYFLEGVHPNGNIGPDPEIHQNGKSAISLNRDLRYHFAHIYRIGHHLKKAIIKTVRHVEKTDLPYPNFVEERTANMI
jgi:hypothetical protein